MLLVMAVLVRRSGSYVRRCGCCRATTWPSKQQCWRKTPAATACLLVSSPPHWAGITLHVLPLHAFLYELGRRLAWSSDGACLAFALPPPTCTSYVTGVTGGRECVIVTVTWQSNYSQSLSGLIAHRQEALDLHCWMFWGIVKCLQASRIFY